MILPTITRQLVLVIALVVLAAIIVFAGPQMCAKQRSMGAQARVGAAQATAASESAKDAMIVVSGAGEAAAASEELSRTNERDIRAAPGADVRVNAGVNLAGRRALCQRVAYRADPKCAMFRNGRQP